MTLSQSELQTTPLSLQPFNIVWDPNESRINKIDDDVYAV